MKALAPGLVCLAAVALQACAERDGPGAERGQRLFEGQVALTARLAGHAQPLPAQASRCVNCHGVAADAGAAARAAANLGAGAVPARRAPLLDRASLVQSQPRRGGPPSAYDSRALCQLLRSGVDPAQVLLPAVMPRYDVSDAQCADLWTYLTRP